MKKYDRMKKQVFSLILALALLCTLFPQVILPADAETASGRCGDHLTWSFDSATGLLSIEGYGAMDGYEYEEYYDTEDHIGRGVTTPWAEYRESITAVSLPQGLPVSAVGAHLGGATESLTYHIKQHT